MSYIWLLIALVFFGVMIIIVSNYQEHEDIRRTLYLDTASEYTVASSSTFSDFYTYENEIDVGLSAPYYGEFVVKVLNATSTKTIEFQAYNKDNTALGNAILITDDTYNKIPFDVKTNTSKLKLKYKTSVDDLLSVYRIELYLRK